VSAPIDSVFEVLQKYKPSYEKSVVEVIMATIVANKMRGTPVWLMLIAPPSAGKTIVLEPLEMQPNSVLLSKITDSTLLSGAADRDGKSASLLHTLGSKPMIVIKDLGQMLQASRFKNSIIFDQLRDVYDGSMQASYGVAGKNKVRWPKNKGEKGKATVIVGMTPAIDLYTEMNAALGERFIRYRFSFNGSVHMEDVMRAMTSTGDEDAFTMALGRAYTQCLRECSQAVEAKPLFAGEDTKLMLAKLTEFLRYARTTVARGQYSKADDVVLVPDPEMGFRLGKILWLLANALCILRDTNDIRDPALLEQICFDTISEPRRSVLMELVKATREGKLLRKADFKTEVSKNTIYRVLEDLKLIGIIEGVTDEASEGRGRPPTLWGVTDKFMAYLP
jgi:hypothetical protein